MIDEVLVSKHLLASQPASQPASQASNAAETFKQKLGDGLWAINQTFRQMALGFRQSMAEGRGFSDGTCGSQNYDLLCRGFYGMVFSLGGGLSKGGSGLVHGIVEIFKAKDNERKIETIGIALASAGQIAGIFIPGTLAGPTTGGMGTQALLVGKGGQLTLATAVDTGTVIAASGQVAVSGGVTIFAMSQSGSSDSGEGVFDENLDALAKEIVPEELRTQLKEDRLQIIDTIEYRNSFIKDPKKTTRVVLEDWVRLQKDKGDYLGYCKFMREHGSGDRMVHQKGFARDSVLRARYHQLVRKGIKAGLRVIDRTNGKEYIVKKVTYQAHMLLEGKPGPVSPTVYEVVKP